jgi:predicted Zn finger-like uncharacterized protein
MTDSFVTQCPHCRTSFRVSRAQLGAARGAVRCGACLHVFNAAEHLIGDPAAIPPSPTPPRPTAPAAEPPRPTPIKPPPAKSSDDTLWIHDDLDLDSLDLDEELAKLEQQEQQLLSQEFMALERAPKPAERLLQRQVERHDPHDESWAEALLNEEQATPPKAAPVAAPPPAKPAPAPMPRPAPVSAPREPELDEVQPPAASEPRTEPVLVDTTPPVEPEPSQPSAQPERNEPALRDESLFEFEDEPLLLDWQRPKKPWGRWIGWGLLNLIAAAALAGQYVWYHFDELARQEQYRPWFEWLCPNFGCSLPSKVDISLIKSSNLVVRSHPDYVGALIVDAILYNRAPFAQPFPLLELRFVDLNGKLLASRRFKPGEYLAGELAGQAEMPPQTPIRVSLEILDPGTNAVNYSLSFHSPE